MSYYTVGGSHFPGPPDLADVSADTRELAPLPPRPDDGGLTWGVALAVAAGVLLTAVVLFGMG